MDTTAALVTLSLLLLLGVYCVYWGEGRRCRRLFGDDAQDPPEPDATDLSD